MWLPHVFVSLISKEVSEGKADLYVSLDNTILYLDLRVL